MSQPGERERLPLPQAPTAAAPTPPAAPPTTPPRRLRPVLSWTAAAGALVVAILLVRTIVAYPLLPLQLGQPSAPADTSQQSTDTASSPFVQLSAVSMSSARSGWALGFFTGD